MTILCGTDFSPMALAAGRIAAGMASRVGDSIHLVHVAEAGDLDPVRLEQEAAALRPIGAPVNPEGAAGIPDEILLDRGKLEGTRLLVLGATGRRAATRWLLGSVAERVVQGSHTPVLVIRHPEPLEGWLRGERPLKVMVAADLSQSSRRAVSWIAQLRQFGPLEVTVAHVAWLPGEFARLGLRGPMRLDSVSAELGGILLRDLEKMVGEVADVGPVRFLVQQGLGRPDVHLAAIAEAEAADLVVVGAHQRGGLNRWWHGSVARGVLEQSATNVAVVPMTAENAVGVSTSREMGRLLVATDLSAAGNEAVSRAFQMAPAMGAIFLAHVRRDESAPRPEDELRSLIPASAATRGLTVDVLVLEGSDVAETLVATAERLGVDAVCIGSHGRSGISAALLGSVAQRVLSRCDRPVIMVRPARPAR